MRETLAKLRWLSGARTKEHQRGLEGLEAEAGCHSPLSLVRTVTNYCEFVKAATHSRKWRLSFWIGLSSAAPHRLISSWRLCRPFPVSLLSCERGSPSIAGTACLQQLL